MVKLEKEFSIDIEKIRQRSLFIATPMYGGQCSGYYTKSLMDLVAMLIKYGIRYQFFALMNESLISRARNYVTDAFVRSDFSDLLFLDSDIEFNPVDILAMMHISEADEIRIIGAPYPKKSISWEKIKKAVDSGFADENPFVLENYTGDFVFNPIKEGSHSLAAPIEVSELGTGCLMIRREVFEAWDIQRPEYLYTPDHIRSAEFNGNRKIMAYFQDPIMNDRHLSEDYFFCQESRKIGYKIFMCPWMNLNHIGTYKFVGNIKAVSATDSSLTADREAVKGKKD